MQASICSRCGKNPAMVFITKIEGNQTKSEGLCLKCARELHIKPVDDILTKMGISDEDLDNLSGEMMNAMSGVEELMGMDPEESTDNDEDGKTATFPFFGKLLDAFRPNGGASKSRASSWPHRPYATSRAVGCSSRHTAHLRVAL